MDVRLVTEDVRNGGHIVFSSLAKLLTSRFDRCKNNFDEEPDHGIVLPTRFRFPWYNPQSERFDDQEWDVDTLDTNMGEPFFQIYDQEISLNRYGRLLKLTG